MRRDPPAIGSPRGGWVTGRRWTVRGLAVLLVIAVHVGLLASGDIGVDVFFPLSGFLITALLYEEFERHGALSLRRFYARRARRLLPALTVLVVAFVVLSRLVHTFGATWPRGTLAGSTLVFANNWVATLLIVRLLTDRHAESVSDRSWRRFADRAGGALSAALSSPPLRFTGKVSYGSYLYHLPIYYLLLNYAPGRSHYFYGAAVLAASLLAAARSWVHGKRTTIESNDRDVTVPTSISGDMLAVTGLNNTQPETTDTTTGTGAGGSTSSTPASNATGATAAATWRYGSQETQARAA